MEQGPRLKFWIWGLIAFAIVIALSIPLQVVTPFGISEHQFAGTAARVDEIQSAWQAGGVFGLGLVSMIGDLIFIGIYSWGAWIAGRSFAAMQSSILRALGMLICASAALFGLTDYTETILQTVQMIQGAGSDWMAHTAATARPIKMAAFIASFLGVVAAILLHRQQGRAA